MAKTFASFQKRYLFFNNTNRQRKIFGSPNIMSPHFQANINNCIIDLTVIVPLNDPYNSHYNLLILSKLTMQFPLPLLNA
jgi:hypothetical protein